MSLEQEITEKSKEIQTDSYPMSIGEIASMYNDGELNLNPEFQRFFRWDINKKSKFIESILLGIPIPSIFVSQDKDGRWDVIDGLQRLSTIFEFMGILKNPNSDNEEKMQLRLEGTQFLPSLKDKVWEDQENLENSLNHSQRFKIKRSKLPIQIIKVTSDPDAKYELFQRLNMGGSSLKPQEIRNCILIMVNKDFFEFIERLNKVSSFQNAINISSKQNEEQYDMELIVRYLVAKLGNIDNIKGNEDIHDYLTNEIIQISKNKDIDLEKEEQFFTEVFDSIHNILQDDSFKKYNTGKDQFMGAFSLTSYEALLGGLIHNIDYFKDDVEESNRKIKEMYSDSRYQEAMKKRYQSTQRFKNLYRFGQEYFSK